MRFVGIVIDRGGTGLRAWMVVRNVIEGMGVEFMFDLYSPTLKEVEVLRLERRIDEELYYLRDCDPKHSTTPTGTKRLVFENFNFMFVFEET